MFRSIVVGTRKLASTVFPLAMRRMPIVATVNSRATLFAFSTNNNSKISQQQLQKLKEQGKQFYSNQVEKIVQLKSSSDFQKLVLGTSQPIILDLYADWCEPCKKLTPRLENKINSMQNVKLIKINIDKCPQVAHALQVKSVPTVYLLYQGQAVDRIQGNVNEAELEKFFENISKVTGVGQQYKQAVASLEQAKQLITQKKIELAVEILENFKEKKVASDLLAIKELLLTQCYLSLGKPGKFKDAIQRASKFEQFFNQVPDLKQFYQIMQSEIQKFQQQSKQDNKISQLLQKLSNCQQKQQRLATKFQLLTHYKSKQLTENALETAMQIIREDKEWEDKKTNKLVIAMFKEMGNNSPLVQKYRKILQRILS